MHKERMSRIGEATISSIGFILLMFGMMVISSVLMNFVVTFGVTISAGIEGRQVLPNEISELTESIFVMRMTSIVTGIFTILALWLIFRKNWKVDTLWSMRNIPSTTWVLCIVLGLSLFLSLNLIFNISGLFELFPNDTEPHSRRMGHYPLLELLSVVILTPIVEEIIFRGAILRKFLKANVNAHCSILIQALLFAAIHFGILTGLFALICGIVLGYIYVKFDSIWPVVIAHMSVNLTGVILSILASSTQPYVVPSASVIDVVVVVAVSLVVVILSFILLMRAKTNKGLF